MLAALCLSPALANDVLISESEQQPVTQIPFLEGEVTIDGNLNEPQWQQAS